MKYTEINFATKPKSIVCECGAVFLLVPDFKQMDRIIDAHAESHGRLEKSPAKAEATIERIQDLLIKQVLEKSSEMKDR